MAAAAGTFIGEAWLQFTGQFASATGSTPADTAGVVSILQYFPRADAQDEDHNFAQYIKHFIFSQSVMLVPMLTSAAWQPRMQRMTKGLSQTSEYFGIHTSPAGLASSPGMQSVQSEIATEPIMDTRGPSLPGILLAGHLKNVSQPVQK